MDQQDIMVNSKSKRNTERKNVAFSSGKTGDETQPLLRLLLNKMAKSCIMVVYH